MYVFRNDVPLLTNFKFLTKIPKTLKIYTATKIQLSHLEQAGYIFPFNLNLFDSLAKFVTCINKYDKLLIQIID